MDDALRHYLGQVRWRFAHTMPDWPHEYTVKAWRPELYAAFEEVCHAIAAHGTAEPWPPPPAQAIYHNRYLVIDGHKYWAMGPHGDLDPPEAMTVLNRAVSLK